MNDLGFDRVQRLLGNNRQFEPCSRCWSRCRSEVTKRGKARKPRLLGAKITRAIGRRQYSLLKKTSQEQHTEMSKVFDNRTQDETRESHAPSKPSLDHRRTGGAGSPHLLGVAVPTRVVGRVDEQHSRLGCYCLLQLSLRLCASWR